MKRVKISLLALTAIAGVSSAFTSKHAKVANPTYGILRLTVGGHGYVIETFSGLKSCQTAQATCAFTSATPPPNPVATSAVPQSSKITGLYQ